MQVVTTGGYPKIRLLHTGVLALTLVGLGASCRGRDQAIPAARADTAGVAPPSQASPSGTGEVTPRLAVPQAAEVMSDAFANAAQGIRPSVVRIDVELGGGRGSGMASDEGGDAEQVPEFLRRFFDFGDGAGPQQSTPQHATGSGVIIDNAGHVVTNTHVVARAQKVTIVLVDGRKFPGKVLGKDPHTDISVVQFEKNPGGLTIARVGNSDQLRVGQWVLAVGSPLGMDQSVTAGIVSGLGNPRSRLRVSERARGYIQTDANINPGNSGGPLVNLAGEVVGINTMINVGPGGAYGLAIPVSQVAQVSQTLIKEGRVRYPYIGVNIGNIDDLSDQERGQLGKLPAQGAVVVSVVPGSPAAEAGLQSGDVITRIGDRNVEVAADVVDAVSSRPIGSKVKVEYSRAGKSQSADVTLRELPGEEQAGAGEGLGMALQTLNQPLARSLGLDPDTKGAVVADVAAGSPAAKAGLHPGDVIVEVDRKPVASAEAVAKALEKGDKRAHLLRVVGAGGARFVTLTPP
jgi:serine protease Do